MQQKFNEYLLCATHDVVLLFKITYIAAVARPPGGTGPGLETSMVVTNKGCSWH